MHALVMRFPGGRAHALTLSYDDGIEADIRLIEIMKKNGLKGTFNINSALIPEKKTEGNYRRRLSLEEVVDLYDGVTTEVAIHGAYHPSWGRLPIGSCQADITADRLALEKIFGRIVRGGAYPNGSYSDMTVDCLRTAGIAYCRTTVSTRKFDIPTDWLRLPATCHHADSTLFTLADQFLNDPFGRVSPPRLFYLWGHSYEFGDKDNWDVIERFAEKMGGRSEIWYATNIEIYDYVTAYGRLEFSANMEIVHNPTALDLWFELDTKPYKISAGQTVSL